MSCATFVSYSFAVRTAAHLAHLTAKTYAHHMALGDFYDTLTELTDKYAEVCMGLEGKQPVFPGVKALDYDNPVELVEDYLEYVQSESKDAARGSQALLNILAELEELSAQTVYKLKFLK